MNDWIIPAAVAILGGGGIGAVITALIAARSSAFAHLNGLINVLQEERAADRAAAKALDRKVDGLHLKLELYRQWNAELYEWGMNGAPPPPPERPPGLH